jgi:hypothetical protein
VQVWHAIDKHGGQIIKHAVGFTYRLHSQPESEEGSVFFELNPSMEPGETWKVWPLTNEARESYRAFTLNPENGVLEPVH